MGNCYMMDLRIYYDLLVLLFFRYTQRSGTGLAVSRKELHAHVRSETELTQVIDCE